MHDVDVEADDPALSARVEAVARGMLEAAGLEAAELSVVLTDDAAIQALNLAWRSKDQPTDVLSFPQQDPPVRGGLLGDVVISLDTAARQAEEHAHDLDTELRVLLAHGLCHLLGEDHETEAQADAMARRERGLLAAVGESPAGLVERVGAGR